MAKRQTKRIPRLTFTTHGIGWHVSFRDPITGVPRKQRFGVRERGREADARVLYERWLVDHHEGNAAASQTLAEVQTNPRKNSVVGLAGSLSEIAGVLIEIGRSRTRKQAEPRTRGTMTLRAFKDRIKQIHDFLKFLDTAHGPGAAARMRIADLSMDDVEQYNRFIVSSGFSAPQVAKRMQLVKGLIARAGRQEHGRQILTWNWDSRDVYHGTPPRERTFPTLRQLKRLILAADLRGKAMIWLGIGLGFGARDLASIRVGQIIEDAYDLRRGKTGIERYGNTPRLVWLYVAKYQRGHHRPPGGLLFVTRKGMPLVHESTNAVTQWWEKHRKKIRRKDEALPGFYTLRHLGATEFGSRPGTSIGEMRRWLGHAASSSIADLYMRPVKPEYRDLVNWIRGKLSRVAPTLTSPNQASPGFAIHSPQRSGGVGPIDWGISFA